MTSFTAWLERRRALRELARAERRETATIGLDDANPLNRARLALDAGDKVASRHYLTLAQQRIPQFVSRSPETIDILLRLGEFAEAERYAQDGAKRFPGRVAFWEGYALVAEKRGDLVEALRRWEQVAKRFPSVPRAHISAAGCLRMLNRFDEADALAGRAARQFPDNIGVLLELGRIADAKADWPLAHARWTEVAKYHPAGISGAAQALHRMGRSEQGRTLLVSARTRFPLDEGMAVMAARIAEEEGATDEAARLWEEARKRFPREPTGYREGIRFLREAGRWNEAFELAVHATEIFNDADWPQHELRLCGERADPQEERGVPPRNATEPALLSPAEVAARFESLGGGRLHGDGWGFGCEFGFWQRHCGIEPMGLFRWASISPEGLAEALESRFDGIDDPDLIEVFEHTGTDWGYRNTRYRATWDHTNLDRSKISAVVAKQKIVSMIRFLKRKIQEDLANPSNIFVYRVFDGRISDDRLLRLGRAVRLFGPGQLLYVTQAQAAEQCFSVDRFDETVLIGHIDAFAPHDNELIYNNEGWHRLCRSALSHIDKVA